MIRLAIVGYGKMGKEIQSRIDKKKFVVTGQYDIDNKVQENLEEKPDVAIEFSTPQSVIQNIEFLASKKINIVCGTTGWYDKLNTVREIIKKNDTGFIYASNFSIGMNIFFEIVKKAGEAFNKFKQYDVGIQETHHIHKLDKPSGTALTIRDIITEHLKGRIQIDILSRRVGDKFGDHKVTFDSPSETITLEHSAKSRSGFAEGALLAAEFIYEKKGFYRFEEIFNKN